VTLRPVIVNNAAKYTPQRGHIWLTSTVSSGIVTVSVRDDGIGIRAETLSRMFDMFGQIRSSVRHFTRTRMGTPWRPFVPLKR